jgi:hypothetical protein
MTAETTVHGQIHDFTEFSASTSFFPSGKCGFKSDLVIPIGKVGDEILPHFCRQILAAVGIKTSLVAQGFKIGSVSAPQQGGNHSVRRWPVKPDYAG